MSSPAAKVENSVDVALAVLNDQKDLNCSILGLGDVEGFCNPTRNMHVTKSGRTTGITHGEIEFIDSDIEVVYGGGKKAYFANQIQTKKPMSLAGDSGSLLTTTENGPREAVGLIFAGTSACSFANHFSTVQSELLRSKLIQASLARIPGNCQPQPSTIAPQAIGTPLAQTPSAQPAMDTSQPGIASAQPGIASAQPAVNTTPTQASRFSFSGLQVVIGIVLFAIFAEKVLFRLF